jgi:hypothetical protein
MANALEWRPEWIRTPAIRTTLVCGCPGSGKSTYVKKRRKKGDQIIDLDLIKSAISGIVGHIIEYEPGLLEQAIIERNRSLDALADATDCKAWVVMGLPLRDDRLWWSAKLNAKVVVIETSLVDAASRILGDRRRLDARQLHIQWAQRWWNEYQPCKGDIVLR